MVIDPRGAQAPNDNNLAPAEVGALARVDSTVVVHTEPVVEVRGVAGSVVPAVAVLVEPVVVIPALAVRAALAVRNAPGPGALDLVVLDEVGPAVLAGDVPGGVVLHTPAVGDLARIGRHVPGEDDLAPVGVVEVGPMAQVRAVVAPGLAAPVAQVRVVVAPGLAAPVAQVRVVVAPGRAAAEVASQTSAGPVPSVGAEQVVRVREAVLEKVVDDHPLVECIP